MKDEWFNWVWYPQILEMPIANIQMPPLFEELKVKEKLLRLLIYRKEYFLVFTWGYCTRFIPDGIR